MAFLFFLSALVLELYGAAAGDPRFEHDQRAVAVDGQRLANLFERAALRIFSAHTDRHLHQHALTAAPRTGSRWHIRNLGHATSLIPIYRASGESRGEALRKVRKSDF